MSPRRTIANRTSTARALGAASVAAAIAAVSSVAAAEWVWAVVATAFPVLLIAFAAGPDRVPRWALAALAALLVPCAAAILLLEGRPGPPAGGGLPLGTWLMALGLGVAPLVLVAVVSAVRRRT